MSVSEGHGAFQAVGRSGISLASSGPPAPRNGVGGLVQSLQAISEGLDRCLRDPLRRLDWLLLSEQEPPQRADTKMELPNTLPTLVALLGQQTQELLGRLQRLAAAGGGE